MTTTLAALPQFVRYLSLFPPPAMVVEAAVRGPLAALGARAAVLWQVRGDHLAALGSFGHTPAEALRYSAMPLSLDVGVCAAVNSRRSSVDDLAAPWPAAVSDLADAMITDMLARLDVSVSVSQPVMHGEAAIGAFGFLTARRPSTSGHDRWILDGVAAAIAMWMSHPASPIEGQDPAGGRSWSLALTARQRRVLHLVAEGRSTSEIAAALHVSDATVKADLQRCMKALRTSDRHEAARRAQSLRLID